MPVEPNFLPSTAAMTSIGMVIMTSVKRIRIDSTQPRK